MRLEEWMRRQAGLAHRQDAYDAGYGSRLVNAAVRSGLIRRIRRHWIATDEAPPDLLAAACRTSRITCVTLARRRGWWVPPDADARTHLAFTPHGAAIALDPEAIAPHWSIPLVPSTPRGLEVAIEDALAHIAVCLPSEEALIVWESAIRSERLAVDAVRAFPWPTPSARACADQVQGLSDSGMETILVIRLRPWGLPLQQQAVIAGHRVDLLVGDRLVVQVDGHAFHSTPAQRRSDAEHDAELAVRGYTVLRFTYAQIIHDWASVERTIARAVGTGLHRAA